MLWLPQCGGTSRDFAATNLSLRQPGSTEVPKLNGKYSKRRDPASGARTTACKLFG